MKTSPVPDVSGHQPEKPPQLKWGKWVTAFLPLGFMLIGYCLGGLFDMDIVWKIGGMIIGGAASVIPLLFLADWFPDAFPLSSQQDYDWMD